MASIQKYPNSPYWMARYRSKNGTQHTKSTKLAAIAKNRKLAQKIADSYEEAYRTKTVVKTLRDNYADISQDLNRTWSIPTIFNYCKNWLKIHTPKLAESTLVKYTHRIKDLSQFLTETGRADLYVNELMEDERAVIEYRNRLLGTVSTVTAKNAMTILAGIFSYGIRKGYYIENQFNEMADIVETDKTEKRPFTLDELKLVLENCNPEWRSMVIFGLYTGQRISDIAGITWQQVDIKKNEISFMTKKTSRRMAIPIAKPLKAHILTLRRGTPAAPVHANAYRLINEQGRASTLSRQFNEILQKANLVKKKSHSKRKSDPDKSQAKETNALSFHSVRHTAGTLLSMTGASEAVSREIIGHDSVSVNRGYVHTDSDSMQSALNKLPDITA